MQKKEYRSYLRNVKRYIKLRPVLKDIGLDNIQSQLSRFIQSDRHDYLLSEERLEEIKKAIEETCDKFV